MVSQKNHNCLRIAHRGASGHAQENTRKAIEAALQANAEMVELDVRQCASGEIVVFHDATLRRLVGDRRRVKELTLKELQELTYKKGTDILTLQEAMDVINKRVGVYIEIKCQQSEEFVARIIQNCINTQGWKNSQIFLASHYVSVLRNLNKLLPDVERILIINSISMGRVENLIQSPFMKWYKARQAHASILSYSRWLFRKRFVQQSHKRGYLVFVWTVNDRKRIQQLKKWGVDGIVTDYPEKV